MLEYQHHYTPSALHSQPPSTGGGPERLTHADTDNYLSNMIMTPTYPPAPPSPQSDKQQPT